MNKKSKYCIALIGTIICTSTGMGLIDSNAYEVENQKNIIKKYYNFLDDETKNIIAKEDVKVEEKVEGKNRTIIIKNKNNELISETTITEITKEEAIQNAMNSQEISYEEASKIINDDLIKLQNKYSLTRQQAERSASWHHITNTRNHTYGLLSAKTQLYADYLLYRSGSFGSIENIRGVDMKLIGVSGFNLTNVNARHMVTSFPTLNGPIRADANLETTTNYAIATSLEKLGFQVEFRGDGTYYCRKPITHSYTYSI